MGTVRICRENNSAEGFIIDYYDNLSLIIHTRLQLGVKQGYHFTDHIVIMALNLSSVSPRLPVWKVTLNVVEEISNP